MSLSWEDCLLGFKELGFPKHYENVTLIHYNITGKKPDDISYLEDKLLADFDLLVETYDKNFKNNRSKNVSWKLNENTLNDENVNEKIINIISLDKSKQFEIIWWEKSK